MAISYLYRAGFKRRMEEQARAAAASFATSASRTKPASASPPAPIQRAVRSASGSHG